MRQVLPLHFPTFGEVEVAVAIAVLRDSRRLATAALVPGEVTGEAGLRCLPDMPVAAADPAFDALPIPGGDLILLRDADHGFDLARAMVEAGTLVAAIGAGPYVRVRAGLLRDRPSTVGVARQHRDLLGCLAERGFRDEPLVEAGPIPTAQGHAFVAFGPRAGEPLGADVDQNLRDFSEGRRNPWMTPSQPRAGRPRCADPAPSRNRGEAT